MAKNRNGVRVASPVHAAESFETTGFSITYDLLWVVVLNLVILGLLLAIYFTNMHSQYLERWFAHYLHI